MLAAAVRQLTALGASLISGASTGSAHGRESRNMRDLLRLQSRAKAFPADVVVGRGGWIVSIASAQLTSEGFKGRLFASSIASVVFAEEEKDGSMEAVRLISDRRVDL